MQKNTISVKKRKDEEQVFMGYFPSDIRNNLQSGLKMRTIMILTEIAYQNPTETNLNELFKRLKIPKSTLSDEIKKLINFGYIKHFSTLKVLTDTRYKTYSITSKGFQLLYILKDAFHLTINQINEKQSTS
ncbi:MAG: MarR family transcriptional regulator [Candidatus Hodarchaeales archaeon]|jgi:DNA-binding MarR family transcriptional regulator